MRFLCLLGLLVTLTATPAKAQSPAITDGQEAALLSAAVFTTFGSAWLLFRVAESADLSLASIALPFYALPAVAPSTVCGLGAAMGLDGRCVQAFRSAFLYALPGYILVSVGLAMQSWDGLGLAVLGGLGLVLAPPFAATDSYRRSVTPAVVSDPANHRAVPGVQLRLSL